MASTSAQESKALCNTHIPLGMIPLLKMMIWARLFLEAMSMMVLKTSIVMIGRQDNGIRQFFLPLVRKSN